MLIRSLYQMIWFIANTDTHRIFPMYAQRFLTNNMLQFFSKCFGRVASAAFSNVQSFQLIHVENIDGR